MRLVDKQPDLVFFLDGQEPRQVGGVAVHAVDAFDHDQDVAVFLAVAREQMVEMIQVVVAEFFDLRRRAVGARDDAVMREFVDEDRVALAAHQPGDRRHIGEIAGDERQRAFHAKEFGDLRLERLVRGAFAADKPRGQRADAEAVDLALCFLADPRVIREPEIIVIGEADEVLALRLEFGPQPVDLGEERIAELQQGVASKTESPCRVIL